MSLYTLTRIGKMPAVVVKHRVHRRKSTGVKHKTSKSKTSKHVVKHRVHRRKRGGDDEVDGGSRKRRVVKRTTKHVAKHRTTKRTTKRATGVKRRKTGGCVGGKRVRKNRKSSALLAVARALGMSKLVHAKKSAYRSRRRHA